MALQCFGIVVTNRNQLNVLGMLFERTKVVLSYAATADDGDSDFAISNGRKHWDAFRGLEAPNGVACLFDRNQVKGGLDIGEHSGRLQQSQNLAKWHLQVFAVGDGRHHRTDIPG